MQLKPMLDGITVLDFSQVLAGPTTTRMMAFMGAEVLKVELLPNGDLGRQLPHLRGARSAYHVQQNMGKQSLCVNLKDPRAQTLLRELVPQVDVLVENYSPGVIDRFGLGWDVVHKLNPGLIMCSISAFGQTGPLSRLPGFDYIAQAYSGVSSMIGDPGSPPAIIGLGMGDVATGVMALSAINAALFYRTRNGGRGQFLDISLLETYFHSHELNIQATAATDGDWVPMRAGSHHPAVGPLGFYRGRERDIVIIGITQRHWEGLCQAMGKPELLEDPRFVDTGTRAVHRDVLGEIIEGWIRAQPSDDAAVRLLEEAHLPVAPVLTVAEAKAQPHMRERRSLLTGLDRSFGEVTFPASPLRFSDFPEPLTLSAPFLGEHNRKILTGRLGRTPAQVDELYAQGVLGEKQS